MTDPRPLTEPRRFDDRLGVWLDANGQAVLYDALTEEQRSVVQEQWSNRLIEAESEGPRPLTEPRAECVCGHGKSEHIYHVGACRPRGIVCDCRSYYDPDAERATAPTEVRAAARLRSKQSPDSRTGDTTAREFLKSPLVLLLAVAFGALVGSVIAWFR